VSSARGGGLGGEANRQIIVLSSLEIAGRRFEDVAAAIDRQASASDVNVGVSILRRFGSPRTSPNTRCGSRRGTERAGILRSAGQFRNRFFSPSIQGTYRRENSIAFAATLL